MNPTYDVMTKFSAKDNVSSTYDRMGRHADKFARKSSSAFRNATKDGYKFVTIVKGILAANAIRGGIGLVTTSIQSAATSFVDFDDTLVKAISKFDDMGPGIKNVRTEINKLKKDVLETTKGTKFTPTEAATALDTLAASGYLRYGSALTGIKTSMLVATATGEDLAGVTSNLSDLMGAFGLRTSDATKEMENFKQLGDVMTLAANLSNVNIMDLKETMEQVGPVSRLTGTSLVEVGAMAAILGNTGIKGTEAATAMKNAMLRLADPKIRKELEANLGPLVDMKTGKVRKISEILATTYKTLKATGKDDLFIAGVLNKVFGLRAVAGAKNIADSIKEVVAAEEKLKQAGGTAANQSEFISQYSLAVKMAMLKNTLLGKTFEIFESFNKGGQQGIEGLVEKIEKTDMKGVIRNFHFLADAVKTVWSVIKPFLPYIPAMVKAFITWKVAVAGIKIFTLGKNALFLFNTLRGGLGTLGAVNTLLGGISGHIALIAANFLIWSEAIKSLNSDKDNAISQLAQAAGIVPKLATDENGVVTGRAPDAEQYSWWGSRTPRYGGWQPPTGAGGSTIGFHGRLDIAGPPQGSTFTSTTKGAPALEVNMLGANP